MSNSQRQGRGGETDGGVQPDREERLRRVLEN